MKRIYLSLLFVAMLQISHSMAQNTYTLSIGGKTDTAFTRAELIKNPAITLTENGGTLSGFTMTYKNIDGDLVSITSPDGAFSAAMLGVISSPDVKKFWIEEVVYMQNGVRQIVKFKEIHLID